MGDAKEKFLLAGFDHCRYSGINAKFLFVVQLSFSRYV
jgi:hypothetical protein